MDKVTAPSLLLQMWEGTSATLLASLERKRDEHGKIEIERESLQIGESVTWNTNRYLQTCLTRHSMGEQKEGRRKGKGRKKWRGGGIAGGWECSIF